MKLTRDDGSELDFMSGSVTKMDWMMEPFGYYGQWKLNYDLGYFVDHRNEFFHHLRNLADEIGYREDILETNEGKYHGNIVVKWIEMDDPSDDFLKIGINFDFHIKQKEAEESEIYVDVPPASYLARKERERMK